MNARVAPPETDKALRKGLSDAMHAGDVLSRLPDYLQNAADQFEQASRQSDLVARSLAAGDIRGAEHHLEMLTSFAGQGKRLFREISAAHDEAKRINEERTGSREPEGAAA